MITIIKGSKAKMTVRLYQGVRGLIGDPLDLTLVTQISACFAKSDGTDLVVTKTSGKIVVLGSPLIGKIQINLTSSETASLATTDRETLELEMVTTGDPSAIQVPDAYSVVPSRC
jgi:hypothetical protein